jgi:hypothetical protein
MHSSDTVAHASCTKDSTPTSTQQRFTPHPNRIHSRDNTAIITRVQCTPCSSTQQLRRAEKRRERRGQQASQSDTARGIIAHHTEQSRAAASPVTQWHHPPPSPKRTEFDCGALRPAIHGYISSSPCRVHLIAIARHPAPPALTSSAPATQRLRPAALTSTQAPPRSMAHPRPWVVSSSLPPLTTAPTAVQVHPRSTQTA